MNNYRRFYGALHRLNYAGDHEDLKVQLVLDYTDGRTIHLHEMRNDEYTTLCTHLEAKARLTESAQLLKAQLKKHRAICLCLMNEYGINTADWSAVDKFCVQPKIAGKTFRLVEDRRAGQAGEEVACNIGQAWRLVMHYINMSSKKAFFELTPPRWGCTKEMFHFVSIECRFCGGRGMIENQEENVTCPVCRGVGQLDAVVEVDWIPSKIVVK